MAVKNNNVGIVRELVGAGVDVNQMEEVSDTCDCVWRHCIVCSREDCLL